MNCYGTFFFHQEILSKTNNSETKFIYFQKLFVVVFKVNDLIKKKMNERNANSLQLY